MDAQALIEARLKHYEAEGTRLAEDWAPILTKIEESRVKKGEAALSAMDKRNLAICFENAAMNEAVRSKGSLFETTDGSNISFLGIQLPVIAAMLPSLVLNEIATVQALERRSGAVFYLDAKYGDTKDSATAADKMADAKFGRARGNSSRYYGSQLTNVTFGAAGDTTASYFLLNKPIVANTVKITDGYEVWSDVGTTGASTGTLVSTASGYTAGTINYTTGLVSFTWTGAAGAKNTPKATYAYFYQKMTAGAATGNFVTSVNFNIYSETITAVDFALQTKFTLAAALDLKKAHGMDLEAEAVRILGNELKFEVDHYGVDQMVVAAFDNAGAGAATTFTATVGTGQEWVWRKYQFIDQVEEASNLIFNKTLRGNATFMIVGNNVARLIKQLKPEFVPAGNLVTNTPTGPYKIGTLGGRTVIQDPFQSTNYAVYGYKGDSFLQASAIYAPYIPMFSTPSVTLADLTVQKAFMSSAAFKIINPGLFANGAVSGL